MRRLRDEVGELRSIAGALRERVDLLEAKAGGPAAEDTASRGGTGKPGNGKPGNGKPGNGTGKAGNGTGKRKDHAKSKAKQKRHERNR